MSHLSAFIRTLAGRGQHRSIEAPSDRKPTLLLHVGPHKTGTTAIQLFCEKNRHLLAKAGFWYPTSGLHSGQHSMLPASQYSHHPFMPQNQVGCDPQAIVKAMQAETPPEQSLLLSSEVFWELLVDLPDKCASLLAMLGRTYHVHIILVQRPDSERTRSIIKHWARIGMAMDAAAGFKNCQEVYRQARTRLAEIGCPVTEIAYDQNDCIAPFLETLSSQFMPGQVAQRLQLGDLIRRCRIAAATHRENVAPSDPWFAAFTIEFSRRLLATTVLSRAYDDRMASLLHEIRNLGAAIESIRRLPDENTVFERVVKANGAPGCLLTPTELQAWESICTHPDVQLAAGRVGRGDELRAVLRLTSQQRRAA